MTMQPHSKQIYWMFFFSGFRKIRGSPEQCLEKREKPGRKHIKRKQTENIGTRRKGRKWKQMEKSEPRQKGNNKKRCKKERKEAEIEISEGTEQTKTEKKGRQVRGFEKGLADRGGLRKEKRISIPSIQAFLCTLFPMLPL